MKGIIRAQVWIVLYLSGSLLCTAQKKYLQPGDMMPDIPLNGMLNYSNPTARISDFRGKLLLIDFWGRGCTSCLESFPKLEALQEQFKGKVQIVTATKDTREEVDTALAQPFMVKRKYRISTLPTITGDTALSQQFAPFFYVPQHIWIDTEGKILYITHGYNATARHIQSVLDGDHPFMMLKSDVKRDVLAHKPLASALDEPIFHHLKYSSLFLNYSDELASFHGISRHIDTATGSIRINYMNMSVLQLMQEAYSDQRNNDLSNNFYSNNRIDWQVDGRRSYFRPGNYDSLDEWTANNCYSYEQVIPLNAEAQRRRWMQEDLNRYFGTVRGIRARRESVRKKCLVMVCTNPDLLRTKGGDPDQYSYSAEGEKRQWRQYSNVRFQLILSSLFYDYESIFKEGPMPFVDETHFTGGADLRYHLDLTSIDALNSELSKYGLKLITAVRTINLLRIEKNTAHENN